MLAITKMLQFILLIDNKWLIYSTWNVKNAYNETSFNHNNWPNIHYIRLY